MLIPDPKKYSVLEHEIRFCTLPFKKVKSKKLKR